MERRITKTLAWLVRWRPIAAISILAAIGLVVAALWRGDVLHRAPDRTPARLATADPAPAPQAEPASPPGAAPVTAPPASPVAEPPAPAPPAPPAAPVLPPADRVKALFAAAQVPYPPRSVVLAAFKDERQLELYARGRKGEWRFVHRYPILGASGTLGPKLVEGDRQVPEGIYAVTFLNPNSKFHLSMRLDYPNRFDRAMAAADKRTVLGGDIMIHGSMGSTGCLAMGKSGHRGALRAGGSRQDEERQGGHRAIRHPHEPDATIASNAGLASEAV